MRPAAWGEPTVPQADIDRGNYPYLIDTIRTYFTAITILRQTRHSEASKNGRGQHCSLHCRLAKLLGLMMRGKYGAVVGLK